MQNSKFKVDLKARCYKFSLNIITLTDALPNKHSSRIIANQLIRAATSMQMQRLILRPSWGQTPRLAQIFMNYEISWILWTSQDHILFYRTISQNYLKSANETKYRLGLLRDANLAHKEVMIIY